METQQAHTEPQERNLPRAHAATRLRLRLATRLRWSSLLFHYVRGLRGSAHCADGPAAVHAGVGGSHAFGTRGAPTLHGCFDPRSPCSRWVFIKNYLYLNDPLVLFIYFTFLYRLIYLFTAIHPALRLSAHPNNCNNRNNPKVPRTQRTLAHCVYGVVLFYYLHQSSELSSLIVF